MELLECLFFILLFYGINSNEILEDEYQVLTLPKFSWLNNRNIQVTFPNGFQGNIKLRAADKIGNMIVPCLYEGVLLKDNSSSVAVSGCQHDDLVNIVMYTSHLPKHSMFTINNGTTREAEKINFDKTNTRGGTKIKRRLRKRGAYLEDGDYDEIDFDGSDPPQPPAFLSLTVKLAFEDSLLTEKKTEVAAREYIARVFTLGKQHFQHASLGTKIRLRAQGPIRRIPGKSWNPSRADIIEARQFKDPEEIPITFFCYNQDRSNDVGIAYRREACHEQKGVSIVAARNDIQKAAQSYSHETGHWLGLPHDIDLSEECEGQGIMSRIDTPGGRPSKWSYCNQRRFNKWYHKDNRKYSQCLQEDGEVLQMESSCLASSYETVVPSIPKCDTVVVSGADYANCSGEYKVSGERVAWSPSKPVYAHISLDRYIYWNVRGHGWSIGNTENIKSGAYLHYSGLDSSEPWEASWRNGITVVCKVLKFQLKGHSGEESIAIFMDGKKEEYTLTTKWQTFLYPRPSSGLFSVEFLNDKGPATDVYIKGHEYLVKDLLPNNSRNKGWGCATFDENERCKWLRNGSILWNGIYMYTLRGPEICEANLCTSTEGCPLAKNTLLTTLPQLNKEFFVSFEFRAIGWQRGWQNVIHFTSTGDNNGNVGDRVPGFWVSNSGQLHPCFGVGDNGNYNTLTTKEYSLNTWHSVEISQSLKNGNYMYQVVVDGDDVIAPVKNTKPRTFSNVQVYAADNFYNPLKGSIKNLHINTDLSNSCRGN